MRQAVAKVAQLLATFIIIYFEFLSFCTEFTERELLGACIEMNSGISFSGIEGMV